MRAGSRARAVRGNVLLKCLLLLALLAGGVWLWWRYSPETLPELIRAQVVEPLQQTERPANPPLYKWKDDQGHWNITDAPPQGRPYETIVVDPNTNVLPSGAAPEGD